MNYDLAKRLKEAGFPQTPKNELYFVWKRFPVGRGVFNGDHWERVYGNELLGENRIFSPTLSELIEACGDRFDSLIFHHDEKQWSGYAEKEYGLDELISADGSTPEEAVANLWLELNKK